MGFGSRLPLVTVLDWCDSVTAANRKNGTTYTILAMNLFSWLFMGLR